MSHRLMCYLVQIANMHLFGLADVVCQSALRRYNFQGRPLSRARRKGTPRFVAKMSSHHITIAKATFAAGLLRPDVTIIHREGTAHFHGLLESAISKCSPSNIQVWSRESQAC